MELLEKFNKIKEQKYHKALRGYTTGIGYTFETLIGKKEDQKPEPDFKGIEIKTKLGYSKSPITLFTLTPKSKHKYSIKYLIDKYGYIKRNSSFLKAFRIEITTKNNVEMKYTNYKLELDYEKEALILKMYNKDYTIIKDEVHWDILDLYIRLVTKIAFLALVTAYDYKINDEKYYNYAKINFYTIKDFDIFLKLIEEGKIIIVFNAEEIIDKNDSTISICDRGTAFRIKKEYLEELYNKIR